jgi:signal transduction histidine kinase
MTAARHAVWAVGLVVVALAVPVISASPDTTYAGTSRSLLLAETAAAVALLVVGAIEAGGRRWSLLAVLGSLWLVPELAGGFRAAGGVRTLADAASWLVAAVATAFLLQATITEGRSRARLTAAALAGGAVAAAARLLLVDPFLDPRCWRTCDPNPWLVASVSGAGPWLTRAGLAVMAATAVVAVAAVPSDRAARRPARVVIPGLVAVGALLVAQGLRPVVTEDAGSSPYVALFVVAQGAALALAATVTLDRYRAWRLGVELTKLARGLRGSPAAGSLAAVLGRAVGDPTLDIQYWAEQRAAFVDADGSPVEPLAPGRASTAVARRGRTVARLVHAPTVDGDRLNGALGAAWRLSLENEALHAALLAELRELEASRARIVERAAAERRLLERNLHDGAQQRVVALSLLVRMLCRHAAGGEGGLAARAETLTRAALEELRRVARGIYPAVLADAGLAGALLDLAQTSTDVVVAVDHVPQKRYQGTVESTAYLVVAAALTDARTRAAGELTVSVAERAGQLTLDVLDDAPPAPTHRADELQDQVHALSGVLQVRRGQGGAHVRVELPCGS